MVVYYTEFDEFKEELERRHWDEELTDFIDSSIDVAIVKEFYANLYDPEDKSPKQVRVRGHLGKFDEDTLNTFLKTPMIMEEGENLCAYSRFALLRPDPKELAVKLCIPGRGFELNADGQPLKILRKNMTTLAQTWSVLSFLPPSYNTLILFSFSLSPCPSALLSCVPFSSSVFILLLHKKYFFFVQELNTNVIILCIDTQ